MMWDLILAYLGDDITVARFFEVICYLETEE